MSTSTVWRHSGVATIKASHVSQLRRVIAFARERWDIEILMGKYEVYSTWLGFGSEEMRVELSWTTVDKKRGVLLGDWLRATLRSPRFGYGLYP